MQVKELKSQGLTHSLEVTVPAQDIRKHIEGRLHEVGKTVRLPGFRPGKAPMAILKQRYGRAVMGDALERAVNESTVQVIKDKGLKPALQPKIEVKDFDEGKDLVFTMEVDVLPDVKVMDLKSIKLKKPVAKAADKEIDEALERVAKSSRDSKPIEGDRATKKGDIVVMDFHGRTKDDGVMHPGMHSHDHKLELGSGQFIPGFEDQLVGKKAGDKVEVNVSFPEDYGAKELAGRDAVFDVDIKEIHEVEAARVDDEMAKKIGFTDLANLREVIGGQIQQEYDQMSRMKLKRALLDVLDENHSFEVPPRMLDLEYENILRQIEQEQGMKEGEGDKSLPSEEKEELRAIADRRVRLGLVLAEVGNENKINVTEQELQRAVINEAQRYRGQEREVFEFYKKNRQALESLRAPIFEEKVVEHIIAEASVSDVTVTLDELRAEEDAELPGKKKSGKKSKAAKAEDGDSVPAKKSAKK